MVAAALLAGLIVGIGFRLRSGKILIPSLAAGLIGLAIYPLLEAVDNSTPAFVVVWLGQSIAIYASVWLNCTRGATDSPEVGGTTKPHQGYPT